jgi:mannose-1-phosphate guanylyltransferase/mannose-6-phosphate isomerase
MAQALKGRPIVPVILSGGAGMRLWPLSRHLHPKQLQALTGQRSMLQETLRRVADPRHFSRPIVVCNEDHRYAVAAQLAAEGIKPLHEILEPEGRNTTAAILAAVLAPGVKDDDVLAALPADHFIEPAEALLAALLSGAEAARAERIVTFGIKPKHGETGYGYLQAGAALGDGGARALLRFIEKPDASVANGMARSPDHFWNAGIFLFSRSTMLRQARMHAPEILDAVERAMAHAAHDNGFLRPEPQAFRECPSISLDYAVMEKTDQGAVVPVEFTWSDIGSWNALWEIGNHDAAGNVVLGDAMLAGVEGSYVRAERGLVAAIGVKDLVIVASGDAVLVAPRHRTQEVKTIVENLNADRRREGHNHLEVHRPWGFFTTVAEGPGHQVKILTIHPRAGLSLQRHRHRAEHWVVVEGQAEVTLDDEVRVLTAHEAVDVGMGVRHRLRNPGPGVLRVVEVQSGAYLGEDDIERFE